MIHVENIHWERLEFIFNNLIDFGIEICPNCGMPMREGFCCLNCGFDGENEEEFSLIDSNYVNDSDMEYKYPDGYEHT